MVISFLLLVEILSNKEGFPKKKAGKGKALEFQLALKVPNKNCSRRHFNFLLISFEDNKA